MNNDVPFETYEDFEEFEPEIQSLKFTTLPDVELLKQAIVGAFRIHSVFERREQVFNNKTYPPQRVLWVSDLLFCPRQKSYELISRKTPQKSDKEIIKISIGSLLHREIQRRMFVNAEFEKRFLRDYNEKYLLVGKIDCLLGGTVIEFKVRTGSERLVKKPTGERSTQKTGHEKTTEVAQYYHDQLQLYMWLTDSEISYLVLISTAGDLDISVIKRNEDRIKTLLEKGVKIIDSLEKLTLPEPDPTYPWLCANCIVEDCEHKGTTST